MIIGWLAARIAGQWAGWGRCFLGGGHGALQLQVIPDPSNDHKHQ